MADKIKSVLDYLNEAHLSNNSTLGSNLIGSNLGSPLSPGLNLSSAYAFPEFNDLTQYHSDKLNNQRYSRDSTELSRQVEHYFSLMHNNSSCFLFRSGMSAIMSAISTIISEVDEVITFGIFYRKTKSILDEFLKLKKIKVLNFNNYEDLLNYKIENPERILFFIENPSNPFLHLIPLHNIRREFPNSKIILDFSMAGLLNHKHIELADIAVTSCTKYIGGRNDLLAGLVIVNNTKFEDKIWQYRSMAGSLIDPISTYLLLRSLRTYDIRINSMLKNCSRIIELLQNNIYIKSIFYPGKFENKIQLQESKETLIHGGSVITFEVKESVDLCSNIENLRSIKMAPTFGSVDSIIEIPLFMSRGENYDPLIDYGSKLDNLIMSNRLVRLSVGSEPISFLESDFKILMNEKKT